MGAFRTRGLRQLGGSPPQSLTKPISDVRSARVTEAVIFGASGYSGLELLDILAGHPAVTVVAASSDRWAGEMVAERLRRWPTDLRFTSHAEVFEATREGQIALLAMPAEASADLAPRLLDRGLRVIDLSGAFRLRDPAAYEEWYGFTHPAPALLDEAVYGLPELFEVPADARLVANPGCYATATIAACAPLMAHHLLVPGAPLVADGKSGVTGAGRSTKDELMFPEVQENLRAYRVGRHQHTPEVEQALAAVSGRPVRLCFTAHLIPMRRGILVSVYAPVHRGVSSIEVERAYKETLGGHPFMAWVDRPPETAPVRGTNFVEVHARVEPRTQMVCAFAAIDNLGKGAAGQAVQNLNLLLGLPEATGLLPAGDA
ncbi:MAG: N-acetyl-gamma-glutamyl-phosphate reductase [Myxococcales bacterium]|nr:N-acetyl-gamma-glutamyl-phosphate reductase [Myxococcales bacterium]MCB9649126.1 N-acetyl-gamma-glutamyl-phosphate reductase [Deltaproteobacteria bacterium]